MEFKERIEEHVKLIKKYKEENFKEEQTKMYLIAPFLNLLGYNVFNPDDVIAEYVSDIGEKKGEKVDYALKINGEIEILIETKPMSDNLENHDVQLQRYFNVTRAKIGILTNGIIYKFFTDLEQDNIMDNKPFLIVNFSDITEDKIPELKKFTKASYNQEQVLSSAEKLKYSNGIKLYLNRQLEDPDDDFIKIIGDSEEAKYVGIISFIVENISSDSLSPIFSQKNIIVRTGLHCAPLAHKFLRTFPVGTIRLSTSYFTSEEDFKNLILLLDYIEENI